MLLFSMVAHEYAHGWAALRQGDPTAYQLGRLTWNPAKHIDPFMTILLPALTYFGSNGSLIFGGAKPVPVVARNFRQYKRGDIIVSLAGVAANAVIAVGCVLIAIVMGVVGRAAPGIAETLHVLQRMFFSGVVINLVLIMFNLMPIPPLDGSHVMKYLLPPAWALQYQRLGMYGMVVLLLLLTIGRPLVSLWMSPVRLLAMLAWQVILPFDLGPLAP